MMRLRPNRCLWTAPPVYQKKGRPRKHGQKFKLAYPDTWTTPTETLFIEDPTWGTIEIKRWSKFHFQQTANVPREIILIQSCRGDIKPRRLA